MKHDDRMRFGGKVFFRKEDLPAMKSFYDKTSSDERKLVKRLGQKVRAIEGATVSNGSGLKMSAVLREFFAEYNNRVRRHGYDYLPSSFNVAEAFLDLFSTMPVLRLWEEREHVVREELFWSFATDPEGLPPPNEAANLLESGVIYSYDFFDVGSLTFTTLDETKYVISGVSMVRHDSEVSFIVEAGKHPVDEVEHESGRPNFHPQRQDLAENSVHTTIEPVRLSEADEYQRVLILYRLDFEDKESGAQFLLEDLGAQYKVITTDFGVFHEDGGDHSEIKTRMNEQIQRSRALFDLCHYFIHLPRLFEVSSVQVENRAKDTQLARWAQKSGRKLLPFLPARERVFARSLKILDGREKDTAANGVLVVPIFARAKGYWKPLHPEQTGKDKRGHQVKGRTWVSGEQVADTALTESFIRYNRPEAIPPNPEEAGGYIYVMHSAVHDQDMFKVGMTRRSPELRAKEISRGTGVATPYLVLKSWWFDDRVMAERIVHDALAKYRVNDDREFFQCSFETIVDVIFRTQALMSGDTSGHAALSDQS